MVTNQLAGHIDLIDRCGRFGFSMSDRSVRRLAQREPTSHVTRTPVSRSKVKGQLVADVLNSQRYLGTGIGATWRINTKILSICRGWRHIVTAACLQLVVIIIIYLQRADELYNGDAKKYPQRIWLIFNNHRDFLHKLLHTSYPIN